MRSTFLISSQDTEAHGSLEVTTLSGVTVSLDTVITLSFPAVSSITLSLSSHNLRCFEGLSLMLRSSAEILFPGLTFTLDFLVWELVEPSRMLCSMSTRTEDTTSAMELSSVLSAVGRRSRTFWRSTGCKPVARKPLCRFCECQPSKISSSNCFSYFGNWSFDKALEWWPVFSFQSLMTVFPFLLAGRKNATSKGCIRCVAFFGRHKNLMLHFSASFSTS